jgi:hypothetical protein
MHSKGNVSINNSCFFYRGIKKIINGHSNNINRLKQISECVLLHFVEKHFRHEKGAECSIEYETNKEILKKTSDFIDKWMSNIKQTCSQIQKDGRVV